MTLPPVKKSVTIDLPPEAAFRRFTEQIQSWWPRRTHSVGQGECEEVVFEARTGGRVYERLRDGSESTWGTVIECDPPRRLVFTWHPGRDPETAQEVEVRFSPSSTGTEVRLEHRNWESFGDGAAEKRDEYEGGWEGVLALYLDLAPSPR